MRVLDQRFDGFYTNDMEEDLIRRIAEADVIRLLDAPVELFSGSTSRVYVGGGRDDVTLNPLLLAEMGKLIAHLVIRWEGRNLKAHTPRRVCLIGIPSAGNVLAQSASTGLWGGFPFLTMNKERKSHGINQGWVNGKPDPKRHIPWGVDNVITGGGSIRLADQHFSEDGFAVSKYLVFFDREQGGVESLRGSGFDVETIMPLSLLLDAFRDLGLWPEEKVRLAKNDLVPT